MATAGWGPLASATAVAAAAGPDHAADPAQAWAAAEAVFLAGNGLPGRWAGRPAFVVLDTGFGLGHKFLATWAAWRRNAGSGQRLVYVAIEPHPPDAAALARVHAAGTQAEAADRLLADLAAVLAAQWPPATPDLHLLDLDGGQVRLMLAFGSPSQVLPELILSADAFYLDNTAPGPDAEPWDERRLRHLHRLAACGATLACRHGSAAQRRALELAGFEVRPLPGLASAPQAHCGRFAPRHVAAPPPGRRPQPEVRSVAVVGAGLAGTAAARALAAQGLAVQVFERAGQVAAGASGNAAGLFHSVVHAQDGVHARWLRAAALHAQRVLRPLVAQGDVQGAVDGLLRGEHLLSAAAMQAMVDAQRQPASHVQVRTPGLGGAEAAWWFPGGGWVAPAELVAAWLRQSGAVLHLGRPVGRLEAIDGGADPAPCPRWRLLDDAGHALAEVDAVVLCNADDALRLLAGTDPDNALGPAPRWPLQRVRGQTTLLPAAAGLPALPIPLADAGYALGLPDGRVLCGATTQTDDDDPAVRDADHAHNLAVLRRLTGWLGAGPNSTPDGLQGRVGWRFSADDRLPLLGPVPWADASPAAAGARGAPPPAAPTQVRRVERRAGLYLFCALGSRGITQAALGAEVLAARLTGAPCPLPASLVDALDPARFAVRAARRGDAATAAAQADPPNG